MNTRFGYIGCRRSFPGETGWGLFTNLNCAADRRALGVTYLAIHAGPFHWEMNLKNRHWTA